MPRRRVLRTDQGRLPDAISYQVQALAIRTKLSLSNSANPARRGEGAYVQVLKWGSRAALLAWRFHVLHLSYHAGPSMLVLENAAGRADQVGATRFAAEGLPADRGVPLVMLAGCSTATAPNPENASPDPEDGAPEARRTVAAVMSSVYLDWHIALCIYCQELWRGLV